MGCWDYTTFGNDDACDWADSFAEAGDLETVEAALDASFFSEGESFDASVAPEAIAAVEVLARLRGKNGYTNPYTEPIDEWVAANPQEVPENLLEKARACLDRILQAHRAALDQSGEDPEAFRGWKEALMDLKARLS